MVHWVLGDQLTRRVGPLADGEQRVLMIEAHEFADRMPYHPKKLTLLFSAMRHFRDELREAGYEVVYEQVPTFEAGLSNFLAEYDEPLTLLEPASHGAGDRLAALVSGAGGTCERVENELFCCSSEAFDAWTDGPPYRHESFYRWMRRETGYLMDDGDPVGGEWNYDGENRQTPPEGYEPPDAPEFEPDELTRETAAWVEERFETWGTMKGFAWPVTREEALVALESFVEDRLSGFGPYQDAMVAGEPTMHHSLLSTSLNLGLLHPREVCERVLDAYEDDADGTDDGGGDRGITIESVEGFLRQVIGWREFMRHVYRREMPAMAGANGLAATRELPDLYYSGETDMRCLSEAVGNVYERGYAHHIERLMVLSNFALLYGASPQELNEWFHFGFVDAYHWVTTPNVVGMGSYGTDVLSSKPYASSGSYVDRMSDYCSDCAYDVEATVGEKACPFNALYWDFLDRNDGLRDNGRMGLVYHNWDRRDEADREAIRERASDLRERIEDGSV